MGRLDCRERSEPRTIPIDALDRSLKCFTGGKTVPPIHCPVQT